MTQHFTPFDDHDLQRASRLTPQRMHRCAQRVELRAARIVEHHCRGLRLLAGRQHRGLIGEHFPMGRHPRFVAPDHRAADYHPLLVSCE